MARKQKLSEHHRSDERRWVYAAKFALKKRDYVEALRCIGWALQHRTAADCAASEEQATKIKKARAIAEARANKASVVRGNDTKGVTK